MKLSELKNGAIVELGNGERYIKIDNTFLGKNGEFMGVDDYNEELFVKNNRPSNWDIVKVHNRPKNEDGYLNISLYEVSQNKWTWERKDNILEDKEKEYLSAVIKPFRDKVEWIRKTFTLYTDEEYITIWVKNDKIVLPNFEKGTMYKNMQSGREYTLEELGYKKRTK